MKIAKGLFIAGLGATAAAGYFFEGRKGARRLRRVRRQLEQAVPATKGAIRNCSRRAKTLHSGVLNEGTSAWLRSPQTAGAFGSILYACSSRRRGLAGRLLQVLGLGLASRGLMTKTHGNEDRMESRKANLIAEKKESFVKQYAGLTNLENTSS